MVTSSGHAVAEEKQSFMFKVKGERQEFEDMRLTLKNVTKFAAEFSVLYNGEEVKVASQHGAIQLPNGTRLLVHITKGSFVTLSRPRT